VTAILERRHLPDRPFGVRKDLQPAGQSSRSGICAKMAIAQTCTSPGACRGYLCCSHQIGTPTIRAIANALDSVVTPGLSL